MEESSDTPRSRLRLAARRITQSAVAKNALSLYSFRFANYALLLVTVPYLVRVLGAGPFGLLGFAQALVASFATFVDYGFDWSATREVSSQRENLELVNRTAMSVWGAKACLLLLILGVLLPLTIFVPKVRMAAALVWALTGILFGRVLFPVWLYQGFERMTGIAVINLSVRAAALICLVLFVRHANDLLPCAIILSGQSLIVGVWGALFAVRAFKIRFAFPRWRDILSSLKDGWALFLSSGAATLYTSGNAFILGMFVHDISLVGYYVAAERLVRVAMDALGPIYQAFYPKINKLAHTSKELALREGRRVLAVLVPLGAAIFAFFIIGAPLIVRIIFGAKFAPATGILRILSFNVLNLAFAAVWSTLMMMSFKRDYAVVKILLGAGLVNVGLAFLLVPAYGPMGMAACVVAAETFVNIGSFTYTVKRGLNPIWPRLAQMWNG
ncbi:MAG TPA: flippase [Terriglobia bacterium]|nr:flippase [Terriglobia bacterium]